MGESAWTCIYVVCIVLTGICLMVAIALGLTVVREYTTSRHFEEATCKYIDTEDLGWLTCSTCKTPGQADSCALSEFPCLKVVVRYINAKTQRNVTAVVYSTCSRGQSQSQCSHYQCSKSSAHNKENVKNFVERFRGKHFNCYYDPKNPQYVIEKLCYSWHASFHCLFWPLLAALILCLFLAWKLIARNGCCCGSKPEEKYQPSTYTEPKMPTKGILKPSSSLSPHRLVIHSHSGPVMYRNGGVGVPSDGLNGSLSDSQRDPSDLSFKSIEMETSSCKLSNSHASIYWSYPSLMSGGGNTMSTATSEASFRTARCSLALSDTSFATALGSVMEAPLVESDAESNSVSSRNEAEQDALKHSSKQRNRLKSRSNPSIKHTLSSLTDPEEVPLKQDTEHLTDSSESNNNSPVNSSLFPNPDYQMPESTDSSPKKTEPADRPQSVYASIPDEDSSPVLSPSFSYYDNIHGTLSQSESETDGLEKPDHERTDKRTSSIRFSLPEDQMQPVLTINDGDGLIH